MRGQADAVHAPAGGRVAGKAAVTQADDRVAGQRLRGHMFMMSNTGPGMLCASEGQLPHWNRGGMQERAEEWQEGRACGSRGRDTGTAVSAALP